MNVDFPKYFPSCVVLLVDIIAGAGAARYLSSGRDPPMTQAQLRCRCSIPPKARYNHELRATTPTIPPGDRVRTFLYSPKLLPVSLTTCLPVIQSPAFCLLASTTQTRPAYVTP